MKPAETTSVGFALLKRCLQIFIIVSHALKQLLLPSLNGCQKRLTQEEVFIHNVGHFHLSDCRGTERLVVLNGSDNLISTKNVSKAISPPWVTNCDM